MSARNEAVIFSKPFQLKGIDRILPAGNYRVVTDEELIEGISFPVYRRVSTMIFMPGIEIPYACEVRPRLHNKRDHDHSIVPTATMRA